MTERSPQNCKAVPDKTRFALAALFAGAAAIGFAPVFIRRSELEPIATGFWRLALAGPLLWSWFAAQSRQRHTAQQAALSPAAMLQLAVPGIFFAVDISLWHWAVTLTTVANATLFVNFAPVFVTLAAWLWLGERFGWKFVMGLMLALGGAAILLRMSGGSAGGNLSGDALAFAAAVFYAGYLVSVKWLRARFPVAAVMSWSTLSAAIVLLPICLVTGEGLWGMGPIGWLMVLGLALVCHISGQGLITFALGHLPASFSSVTLLVQPVAATALAWALLGEKLGRLQVGGGVLVLCGIFVARLGSTGQAQRSPNG